jgi:hypothetical protein
MSYEAKDKILIKKLLREMVNSTSIPNNYENIMNNIKKFYGAFIKGLSKKSNYLFVLGNKINYTEHGNPHFCDVNTYSYIKERLLEGKTNYYPVGGFWFFNEGQDMFEHRWVYDKDTNSFIETSKLLGEKPNCYAGIINFDINDEIKNSNDVSEVKWFREQTKIS